MATRDFVGGHDEGQRRWSLDIDTNFLGVFSSWVYGFRCHSMAYTDLTHQQSNAWQKQSKTQSERLLTGRPVV
jgi:hypothetical protein